MGRALASTVRPVHRTPSGWLRLAVLAAGLALALLAFVPRLLVPADHDHPGTSATHGCAACVLAHSPAEPPELPEALSAPATSWKVSRPPVALTAVPRRVWLVPFACGPPVLAPSPLS